MFFPAFGSKLISTSEVKGCWRSLWDGASLGTLSGKSILDFLYLSKFFLSVVCGWEEEDETPGEPARGVLLLTCVQYFHLKKGAVGRGFGRTEDLLTQISSYLFINLRPNFLQIFLLRSEDKLDGIDSHKQAWTVTLCKSSPFNITHQKTIQSCSVLHRDHGNLSHVGAQVFEGHG